MIASTQLISALRRAATRIEAPGSDYDWSTSAHCNCGFLASALGHQEEDFEYCGHWSRNAETAICTVSQRPIYAVIRHMFEAGLSQRDIHQIEFLSNPEVLRLTGLCEFNRPAHVAKYFRACADLLEEQLTPPPPAPVVVQHGCCHIWLEAGVCMICSATKPVVQPVEVV